MLFEGDLPAALAEEMAEAELVAWDTETTGLDWRTDRLALCQLHAPDVGTALVRVNEVRPVQLLRVLSSSAVRKVFHHAPFDLRFMRAAWGGEANNIMCTKIASKLLAPGAPNSEHSLAALLQRHLGVTLEKGAERVSDWLAPELSGRQLAYAAKDVEFLVPLLERLLALLDEANRAALYGRCCEFLPDQVEISSLGLDDVFAY
jgi:ribonuclease D